MRVLESVIQPFVADEKLSSMMDTFRTMLNDCIRIGLAENTTSFMSLRYACYQKLKDYEIASAYKNNAISRANGILSSYRKLLKKGRKIKTPYCWKPVLTTCFSFNFKEDSIILPSKLKIPLNDYVLKKIRDSNIRSVTVSARTVSICFSREVEEIECIEVLGIDTNLENVTTVSLKGTNRFDMKEIGQVKQNYREVKSHFKRSDSRLFKAISQKYGKLQADKSQSEIHKITARIVKLAKKQKAGIALENLKEIRRLYRRGNGQGTNYRARLNSWAFGEFQRQIEYKAKSEGLRVIHVNARGTSARCSACGNKMFPEESRMLYCPSCKRRVDRDDNAAVNIRKRGLEKLFSMRFKPIGLPSEAMKGNPVKELKTEVILRVDGSQSNVPTLDIQSGVPST
ncbi:MAG: transposase [Nitrososphaerales archaeon]